MAPTSAADHTLWTLTMAEHHRSQTICTQAARARACLNGIVAAFAADRAVSRELAARRTETAALRLWQTTLRGLLAEADDAVRVINRDDRTVRAAS